MPFTCQIPVKPYIKAYIENNCGIPSDLRQLPEVHEQFINSLKYPKFHRDSQAKCNYGETIEVIITDDTFYRHGWQISRTDCIRFNQKCEALIKFNSRQFIMANASLGIPVHKCIREFQSKFLFTEDTFPFATIKRDYNRHCAKVPIKFIRDFNAEINIILLDNLFSLGTISNSFKNEINRQILH